MLIFNATIYPVQEKFYGREVILADRDMVEQNSGQSDHITCSRLIICSRPEWKPVNDNFFAPILQMRYCLVLISVMWRFWLLEIL